MHQASTLISRLEHSVPQEQQKLGCWQTISAHMGTGLVLRCFTFLSDYQQDEVQLHQCGSCWSSEATIEREADQEASLIVS